MAYEAGNNVEQLAGLGLGAWRIAKWWLIVGAVCAVLIALQGAPDRKESMQQSTEAQAQMLGELQFDDNGCGYINGKRTYWVDRNKACPH